MLNYVLSIQQNVSCKFTPLLNHWFPGKGLAAQIAAGINAAKNFTKANEEELLLNPTVAPPAKIEEEIEINELPQQARYSIAWS